GNEEQFVFADLQCQVLRGPVGAWCGYVYLDNKKHPAFGADDCYSDDDVLRDISVHGGITYRVAHKGYGLWVIGFDCSHSGDLSPRLAYPDHSKKMTYHFSDGVYRTKEYAIDETKRLAVQLNLIWYEFL